MGIQTIVPETNPFHIHNALLQWAYKPLCIQTIVPETNPFHVHNALLQWAYKPSFRKQILFMYIMHFFNGHTNHRSGNKSFSYT